MVKILVSDGMDKQALNKLVNDGYEVLNKHFEEEELKDKIKEFDVIVVRSATKIRRPIIDAAKDGNLKLIIRGGVGVDNIDVNYAVENGIEVRNTPNASAASVAELTLAHMFAISRYVNISNVTMRNNEWHKNQYKGVELYGKTLGIIGFGRIAKEVAKRANALGMRIIYNDKLGMAKGYSNYEFCEFKDLLIRSDYITFHIPFSKGQKALIGEKELNIMKDGVYIINCARGGIIDEKALIDALDCGKVAGAGIDVFESEPKPCEELLNNDRVSATPHIGASTCEAQGRIGTEIVNIVEQYYLDKDLVNVC